MFLIYGVFLQNVLISNILHKVECVFQLDDLSLSRILSVREEEKGGGVFNIEKVYVYLNKLCDWRVAKVWCYLFVHVPRLGHDYMKDFSAPYWQKLIAGLRWETGIIKHLVS